MILKHDDQPHDCVISMTRKGVPVLAENEIELGKITEHLKHNADDKCEFMKASYQWGEGQPLIHVPGNGKQPDMMLQIADYRELPDGTSIGKIARVQ